VAKRPKILVVDDDTAMRELMKLSLGKEGFDVSAAASSADALDAVASGTFDVIVTDIYLGDGTGLELLEHCRTHSPQSKVILVTAHGTIETAASARRLGVFDYLAKPFDIQELSARLRALERRLGMEKQTEIRIGPVLLDTAAHRVTVDGNEVPLSRREYMLLKALMETAGSIQTRQVLESKLYSWGEEVGSNAVEVHIHNLRKKLDTDLIQTVRGIGYTVRKS